MRKIGLTLGLISFAVAIPAYADTTYKQGKKKHVYAKDSAAFTTQVQPHESLLNNIFNSTNRPAWLTNTYIGYSFQSYRTPSVELATTQPLYQDCWNTYFAQGRAGTTSGNTTGDLGLGYRILTNDNEMMWGLNLFADESSQYSNATAGIGGEMFTSYITLRFNAYNKLSGTKTVNLISPSNGTYQRALNGYDLSIETPFPFVSWIRFVAQGYRFAGKKSGGANGGEAMLRVYPARQIEIDAGFAADNTNGRSGFMKLDYYFGSPDFIENTMTTPNYYGAYAPVTVERQRLQRVIRHDDIVYEQTNTAVGESRGTVYIRGS